MNDEDREEMLRQARWDFGRAEDCLDVTTASVAKVEDLLDECWSGEFRSDVTVLRSKVDAIAAMIPKRDGPPIDYHG